MPWFTRLFRAAFAALVLFYAACCLYLLALTKFNPPTTGVQIQRRVEALLQHKPYTKKQTSVPLSRISKDLQHAVIAAEDGRFYQHRGIDWTEVNKLVENDLEEGAVSRGGSTITQQLVKNLFGTTHRSYIRKGFEFTLAPIADKVLGKERLLEIYLNEIEWGPGVYGAEAACQYYFKLPASRISRDQAARLAACIPAPRKRRPALMDNYSQILQERMRQMGW